MSLVLWNECVDLTNSTRQCIKLFTIKVLEEKEKQVSNLKKEIFGLKESKRTLKIENKRTREKYKSVIEGWAECSKDCDEELENINKNTEDIGRILKEVKNLV